jgi:hypothetical protein
MKPAIITSNSRVTLAVVFSLFAGGVTLASAWVSQSVATTVSQSEILNLKQNQSKTEEKLDIISVKLSEIGGTLKEMQRQEMLRHR